MGRVDWGCGEEVRVVGEMCISWIEWQDPALRIGF